MAAFLPVLLVGAVCFMFYLVAVCIFTLPVIAAYLVQRLFAGCINALKA
nr:MAG TPA: hypothetical protein [Bacteriophage sp.]